MKRLIKYIFVVLLIPLLTGCVRIPYADFVASAINVNVGEVIYFTNQSHNAESFDWDFGDGYYASNFNVSHAYDTPGHYNVILTAQSRDNRTDVYSISINVYDAQLNVQVVEYYSNYVVPDASVRLYPTVTDWENETNMIVEGFTDSNGEVTFAGLIPGRKYYVDVWEANHDNYTLASEDVSYIETQSLLSNQMNYFTALVDYYPPAKKSSVTRKEQKRLRKAEATGHTPRIK